MVNRWIALVGLLAWAGGPAAAAGPKEDVAAAYQKLEALKSYRERITFNFSGFEPEAGDDDMTRRIAGMMAPFKSGIVRETVPASRRSRMTWSFPNPSPVGSQITIEMVEDGTRIATRYNDARMMAAGAAATAVAQARLAADNALNFAKGLAGGAMNPMGLIGDVVGLGMQGLGRTPPGSGTGDWGKWVCRTDEPIVDKSAGAPVVALPDGVANGKAVRRYKVSPPPGDDEASPHVLSVDKASGLPVLVEVMDEEGQTITTVEFYDVDAPIQIEFPTCDKNG